MEASKSCSFCGQIPDEHVQMFDAEANVPAAICAECVLTCAKAVDVERRLSERPLFKARGDSAPDSERPPALSSWASFRVGPLDLEWLAETAMVVRVRRSDNHERAVVESFPRDTEPTVDDAETVAEDHWVTLHG